MSIFNSDIELEVIASLLKDVKTRVHFIGVLGSGLYPLAKLLKGRGYHVSGSDEGSKHTFYVDESGIEISNDSYFLEADLVVYSLAIDGDDPGIRSAIERGITLISRAQLLGCLMSGCKARISVSGSHGKSTTTAIIDRILCAAQSPHTTVSGASLSSGEQFIDAGKDIFLAEACEYKDSFLSLCPTHQIITAVELDHTDYFKDIEMLCNSFYRAAQRAEVLLANADDERALGIATDIKHSQGHVRVLTYGRGENADYRILAPKHRGSMTDFSILSGDKSFNLTTTLIGEFNLYNIAAAVAMADIIGVPSKVIEGAAQDFRTIERRMSHISDINGVAVYYDYAHHPTEIAAVIDAIKERHGTLTVIFRPHTYSRTQSLWSEFKAALCKADFSILLDIYPAREKSIDGVTSQALAAEIPRCRYLDASEAVAAALSRGTSAIALLGAGEVDALRCELIRLGEK